MPNVVPAAFEDRWTALMDGYGGRLLAAVTTVCEMLAVGLGLPRDAITSAAAHGSHLLAPTATDLRKHGIKDTIFAGFHSCAVRARRC